MPIPRCQRCTGPMPVLARAHAQYCSTRCRVAASRARKRVPGELLDRQRWVRHTASKVPLTLRDTPASSTDPATWTTYDRVVASTVGVGMGFVLSGEGIVCVDLDHCLDATGRPVPWAARLLEQTPDTWIEVSPSGAGLHIWGRADFMGGRRIPQPGGGVEVYGSGRYITVTGRPFRQAPAELADITDLISSLI